jgi:hypothetical protein
MGVCGVHGVFRRCCEETLAVMRANKESLLTIVEVFIHDPLYKWALSPLKALQRQRVSNELVAHVMFVLRGHSTATRSTVFWTKGCHHLCMLLACWAVCRRWRTKRVRGSRTKDVVCALGVDREKC